VRLLVDTHIALWWVTADRRLPQTSRELIASADNDLLVSAASFWEVAIKAGLGRIDVALDELRAALRQDGFEEVAIEVPHTLQLVLLPSHHRDPFDRLLIAQSIVEGCRFLTADPAILAYAGVPGFVAVPV
jgi:PIN domain nuclease of toxin-antitoxin system